MGFWTILRKCEVCWKLFRSTHMFICWRARKPGTRMNAQASCPNKRVRGRTVAIKNNDPVRRRRSNAMIFELLR